VRIDSELRGAVDEHCYVAWGVCSQSRVAYMSQLVQVVDMQ
jgi:hypothetical protein